jgi:hypothetical protein
MCIYCSVLHQNLSKQNCNITACNNGTAILKIRGLEMNEMVSPKFRSGDFTDGGVAVGT